MSVTLLREVILPEAFTKNGSRFLDCEVDTRYSATDCFQSTVVFLTATVQKDNETIKLPLVVKFEPKDEVTRTALNTNIQFHNEVFMYSSLLPFLEKNNICGETFPKFYYGVGTIVDPDKDVIVIEDLRPKAFKLTDEKVFIDYPHFLLAMKKLGRFHALSYAAKKHNPGQLNRLVENLKEPSWLDDSAMTVPTIQLCFHRAMDPLIASGRHADVLRRVLSRVDNSVVKFLLELVSADEPMAVVCHGDFCRNNMLFKYDQASGAPTDVKFFDVATARYSSPAVDIAFFLLLNSSRETRTAHWDDLLEVYHRALSDAVPGVWVPSLQDIQREVRLKAVYGFVHCSFFLPMMLYGGDMDFEEAADIPPEEMGCMNAALGGEEGTKLLMDMVEDLVERGCLTLDHPVLKDVGE